MPPARNKLFVLDTNVILHDAGCMRKFAEHDVAIPIVVLEELDRFKRGNEQINAQARHFLRELDGLTGEVVFDEGARLGDGLGRVRVLVNPTWDPAVREVFQADTPDHRILNTAIKLMKAEEYETVIVVSKDTNLRMKAKSLGIPAHDYTSDKVESLDKVYSGRRVLEGIDGALIDRLHTAPHQIPADEVDLVDDPVPNENYIIRTGSKSVLATYDPFEGLFERVERCTAYGIHSRNAEQAFALHALLDTRLQLVTLTGKAGTGKTLLALAGALERRSVFRQIFLARPIVPLSNRDIGFLPGDEQSKIGPYMAPLFDNLTVIKHQFMPQDDRYSAIDTMLESNKLVITPLAYIRGRSFQKVCFIVDEAQNLTPHEVKTIITRAGEGAKIILTGDIEQIDQPYLDSLSNGVTYVINRMKGQNMYAHVTLTKGERSHLAELASHLL